MDKKRLKITLKVLGGVKEHFPDTKNFIEDMMEQQCQKKKISVEEVIFLQVQKQKVSSEKHFLFFSEYVKRYFVKLNSIGYNIYLLAI